MTQPWNAARAASKRPLRKPIKMHGPVGDPKRNEVMALRGRKRLEDNKEFILTDGYGGQFFADGTIVRGEHPTYACCGVHECVCSCKPAERMPTLQPDPAYRARHGLE